jgi:phosphoribosylformylglycinamidine cyclo-ligase
VLNKYYAHNFPESFDETIDDEVVYIGSQRLTDKVSVAFKDEVSHTTIGKLILSPTRTFAPVLKQILEKHFDAVYGLIHCSGGGQTKCMKYMPDMVKVIKDNLFEAPPIFKTIQQSSGADDKEMYQVFNMGCRMEVYTDEKSADEIISTINHFGIHAQVIGRLESAERNELVIYSANRQISFQV